jgi:hypothetical protein
MILDIPVFRAMFPAYADETAYPDSTLETYYSIGKCYVKDNDCVLPSECRAHALNLMLAHLLYIKDLAVLGNKTVVITSATEGPVSVSIAQPPSSDNWTYWLNTTPYGPQVLAMLEVASVGGFYIGGSPERRGFRKINGMF